LEPHLDPAIHPNRGFKTASQRLRRIKQLGVSEFVFPSATHTRFAHCVGVFHTARQLIRIIEREIGGTDQRFDPRRGDVAVIAALLHDLGHGPFSHTFETVQKARGISKRHETWTADIVKNPVGGIRPLLDKHWPEGGFCNAVAELFEAEDPADIYHAVVSSSFDADRLDYLRRDRLMTGTGAGAIDFDWLMEHIRVREIEIDVPEDPDEDGQIKVPTFCIDPKALPAAEQFLLARFTLHEQVYFHKTTRCIEHMIAKLLNLVANWAQGASGRALTGLAEDHPLIRFFEPGGDTVENYLALDDIVVAGALQNMASGADETLKDLAGRLRKRAFYKTLDLRAAFGHDDGKQTAAARSIDRKFAASIAQARVIKDEAASVSIYTQIGGDDERAHKRLHIIDIERGPVEITSVSKIVNALQEKKKSTRYYFESEADRDRALERRRETRDRS
jgi:HD superfamily phosphohydrolase